MYKHAILLVALSATTLAFPWPSLPAFIRPSHRTRQSGPGIGQSKVDMVFYPTQDNCLDDIDSLDFITLDETCRPLPSNLQFDAFVFVDPDLEPECRVFFATRSDCQVLETRPEVVFDVVDGECHAVNGTFSERLGPRLTHGIVFCS